MLPASIFQRPTVIKILLMRPAETYSWEGKHEIGCVCNLGVLIEPCLTEFFLFVCIFIISCFGFSDPAGGTQWPWNKRAFGASKRTSTFCDHEELCHL